MSRPGTLKSFSGGPICCRVQLRPWSNSCDSLMILKTLISMLRVCWLALELNSAGESQIWVWPRGLGKGFEEEIYLCRVYYRWIAGWTGCCRVQRILKCDWLSTRVCKTLILIQNRQSRSDTNQCFNPQLAIHWNQRGQLNNSGTEIWDY